MVNVSFFQDLLAGIAERGKALGAALPVGGRGPASIVDLCDALLSGRGEASGVAVAREVQRAWAKLDAPDRAAFFALLRDKYAPDAEAVRAAYAAWEAEPSPRSLAKLSQAAEPPRQELLRRLNQAPGGTATLVAMREALLPLLDGKGGFEAIDADFTHLFTSWFNRGFLTLKHIDWSTPADILEKIIRYEAVHEIKGWDDLRRRLAPPDRRCFAFFHPALPDEPLIFVEVALTMEIPSSIGAILADNRPHVSPKQATTAVFYSISNCQEGLRGVSFGNFLIKQVVEELAREHRKLDTFVTLSPVPGFRNWLKREIANADSTAVTDADRTVLRALDDPSWVDNGSGEALRTTLMAVAAHYFLVPSEPGGKPRDPVARFHLGNGARLERFNHLGDTSAKGLKQAAGLMVNYLYDLDDIEKNHEAFADTGTVAASANVRRLLRPQPKVRKAATEQPASTK